MKDPETFLQSNLDLSDPEHEMEIERIVAAGKSASSKRNSSKR